MKITVKTEQERKILKDYLEYLNQFSLRKIKVTGKRDVLKVISNRTDVDISKRKSYKLKKFNFKFKIHVDDSLTYPDIKTSTEKEYNDFLKYLAFLKRFRIQFKFCKKSSFVVDGETITNRKGYVYPMRTETDGGYGLLMLANVI